MQYPQGLIRYDSENNIQSKSTDSPKYFRGKTIGYCLVLAVMVALFALKVGTRLPFALDVLRDRGSLYHEESGSIRNDYTLKIANKSQTDQQFTLSAEGKYGALRVETEQELMVPVGDVLSIGASVFQLAESISLPISDITISLCEQTRDQCTHTETRFIGPN